MINANHVLKVTMYWTSIVYTVCYLGVLFFPGIRPAFMLYGLHTALDVGQNVMTLTTFLAVGLFAVLFNRIKT